MKRALFVFICAFLYVHSFSQHWNNKLWYFGVHAAVSFNTIPPSGLGNSAMLQEEGCATMCDINGSLLFYTNGITVWNRNHQIMPNGNGLFGHQSSTQSALIVPLPGSDHLFYIFTTPANAQSSLLRPSTFSIVDLSLNGGLGDITVKNAGLHFPVSEKLTATLKANGTDYWIITKEAGTDAFYIYSFTASGVNTTPVITHAGYVPPYNQVIGYCRVSPNSSKIALAYWTGPYAQPFNLTQLLDFDNNTGHVANPVNLQSPRATYGVEFSPDSRRLYVMQQFNSVLRQYDLLAGSATGIQNSAIEVVHLDSPLTGAAIALGPDAKIYLCNYQKTYLSAIDQPNLAGPACNFVEYAVDFGLMPSMTGYYGLPNNIYYVPPTPGCPQQIYSSHIVSLCPGQTYQMPTGQILSAAGSYQDTIRGQYSCDSIITIVNLTYVATSFVNTIAHICAGQSYQLPSGATFNSAGTYQDTIRSPAGCDSVITTLTLTVFPSTPVFNNISASICAGQSYHLPSGHVVYNTGVYQDTIRNVNGCDSIITTANLLSTPVIVMVSTAHICLGQTYTLPSGLVVNIPGVYHIDTVKSVNGCDSIIHNLVLSVIAPAYTTLQPRICPGQTYTLPSGIVINNPGVYYDTLRGIYGCDSILYLADVQVLVTSYISTSAQICSGQVYYLPSGAIVNAAGIYTDTVRAVDGCDSIISTVNLSVIPAIIINTSAQICSGQTYILPSGVVINTAGVYTDTLSSVTGCDSIITTVTLAVIPGSYVNSNVSLCSGQTYLLPSGMSVSNAGIYYLDTLRSTTGCDSIIHTATLTIFPVSHVNVSANICAGQIYMLPSGLIVSTAGIYQDTIRSVNSCDSIITIINLSVFTANLVTAAVQLCSNQTYTLPSGTIVNTTGIYTDTLRSVAGCDSIITTTTVTVFPASHVNVSANICTGQVYMLPSGTIVSTAGIYVDTLKSVASCDSVITTINLTVLTASLVNTTAQLCSNQTFTLPSGAIVSTAGIYIDTLRSIAGCDSIITHLSISVLPVEHVNTDLHICSNETYHLPSGATVSSTGIYVDTLRSAASCDSIINSIHVFVNDVSAVNMVDSINSGQTYLLPSGETVSAAGVYQSVFLNSAGCDSVITTTLKLKQGVADCIILKNAFTPNGDGINDYWVLFTYRCFKRLEVNVYNRYGTLVYHADDYKNDWDGKYKNKELPDGTYYYVIKIISFDGRENLFKNNVTILR